MRGEHGREGLLTRDRELEAPADVEHVVAKAEEGGDEEREQARQVGRERVVRERERPFEEEGGAGVAFGEDELCSC